MLIRFTILGSLRKTRATSDAVTMDINRVEFHDQKYRQGTERLQPYKTKLIELLLEDSKRGRVLDVGCGSGLITAQLKRAGCDPVGIDLSFPAIRKYMAAGHAGLICNLESALPFRDKSFDLVWMSEVVEYVVEDRALMREVHRILKPHGKLYISVPNSAFVGYRFLSLLGKAPSEVQDPYHVRFYSYDSLKKILVENGFDIDRSMGQNIYIYIPTVVVHALNKLPTGVSRTLWALLGRAGIRAIPGMIRGNKVMGYWFGETGRKLLSSCIMMVGVSKPTR